MRSHLAEVASQVRGGIRARLEQRIGRISERVAAIARTSGKAHLTGGQFGEAALNRRFGNVLLQSRIVTRPAADVVQTILRDVARESVAADDHGIVRVVLDVGIDGIRIGFTERQDAAGAHHSTQSGRKIIFAVKRRLDQFLEAREAHQSAFELRRDVRLSVRRVRLPSPIGVANRTFHAGQHLVNVVRRLAVAHTRESGGTAVCPRAGGVRTRVQDGIQRIGYRV